MPADGAKYQLYKSSLTRATGADQNRGWIWARDYEIPFQTLRITRSIKRAPSLKFDVPTANAPSVDRGAHVVVTRNGADFLNFVVTGKSPAASAVGYAAQGVISKLASVTFPPEYVMTGNISSEDNKARMTSRFVFRRVTTSSADANTAWDGRGALSWNGSSVSGAPEEKTASLSNTTLNIMAMVDFDDGQGVLSLAGATSNNGVQQPPYQTSGTYVSPYIDMRTLDGNDETVIDEFARRSQRMERCRIELRGQRRPRSQGAYLAATRPRS